MEKKKREQIGLALGAIPSGCAIVTTGNLASGTGLLASWIQQCAFEPPMISVAVKMERPIRPLLEANRRFIVNLIGEDSALMFKHFGRGFSAGEPAFKGVAGRDDEFGVILDACIGHLSCELRGAIALGDHVLYVAEVLDGDLDRDLTPLVRLRRNGFDY